MKEIVGDIWDYHKQGFWIVITTNGVVKPNGAAVMGAGIAWQAAQRFPRLQRGLGHHIILMGNNVHCFRRWRLVTFPTKHDWRNDSDMPLIERSLSQLVSLADVGRLEYYSREFAADLGSPIYLVRPGCKNGGLDWKDVKPLLERYLNDRFVVVER